MDEDILWDTYRPICDPFGIRILCSSGGRPVYFIFPHSYVINEGSGQKLSQHFDLTSVYGKEYLARWTTNLQVAGRLKIRHEACIKAWEVCLNNIAYLCAKFVYFFHCLDLSVKVTARKPNQVAYFRSHEVFFAELVTTTCIFICTNDRHQL
jgi:hypothetical protein